MSSYSKNKYTPLVAFSRVQGVYKKRTCKQRTGEIAKNLTSEKSKDVWKLESLIGLITGVPVLGGRRVAASTRLEFLKPVWASVGIFHHFWAILLGKIKLVLSLSEKPWYLDKLSSL